MTKPGYGHRYRQARAVALRGDPACRCGAPATTADHVPALAAHRHIDGSGCCELVPACPSCNARGGAAITNARRGQAGLRRGRGWSAA